MNWTTRCLYAITASMFFATYAFAQETTGFIVAVPMIVMVPAGFFGLTSLSWEGAYNVSSLYVTVIENGGAEQLVASSGISGAATIPWIASGSTYLFRLRAISPSCLSE
jgi:hypothetical protein